MHLPVYIYSMIFSLIASLNLLWKRKTAIYLRLFPFFLAASVFVEIQADMIRTGDGSGNNMTLYNSFIVVEFVFYLYVLRSVIYSPSVKSKMNWIIFFFILLSVTNLIISLKFENFQSITYAMGSLLVVIYCVFYFYELFNLPEFVDLLREPSFWIVSGLLFYYTCTYPVTGMINHLNRIPRLSYSTLEFLFTWTNVLLYLIFTIAFICRIRIPKFIS